jgi:hypothetical protein
MPQRYGTSGPGRGASRSNQSSLKGMNWRMGCLLWEHDSMEAAPAARAQTKADRTRAGQGHDDDAAPDPAGKAADETFGG